MRALRGYVDGKERPPPHPPARLSSATTCTRCNDIRQRNTNTCSITTAMNSQLSAVLVKGIRYNDRPKAAVLLLVSILLINVICTVSVAVTIAAIPGQAQTQCPCFWVQKKDDDVIFVAVEFFVLEGSGTILSEDYWVVR